MNFLDSKKVFCIKELRKVDLFLLNGANQLRNLEEVMKEIEKRDYKKFLDKDMYNYMINLLKVIYDENNFNKGEKIL